MVDKAPKAIETIYPYPDGYRFRSRLEARWAVFFDMLGIEYEYEKEGYDLGAAGWYLPDFWLPQVRMWAEIKPSEFTIEEREKCRQLARQSDHDCFELVGAPTPKPYYAWKWCEGKPWAGPDGFLFIDYAISNSQGYLLTEHRFFGNGVCEEDFFEPYCYYPDTVEAATIARQTRFGQNGRG